MIIKLNAEELAELRKCELGPYGEDHFYSFMAELCARASDDGEIDLDRDDFERVNTIRRTKHGPRLDKVLKRAIEAAMRSFFG